MASITKLKERKKNPFRAQVKKKGYKTLVAYFQTWELADEWCQDREQERTRLDKGMVQTKEHLQKKTVADLVTEYIKKRTYRKVSADTETTVFERLLSFNNLGDRRLIAFKRQDAWDFIEYLENNNQWISKPYIFKGKLIEPSRQPKHLKPATIIRSIRVLSHMWKEAELKWRGFEELPNPWIGVKPSQPIKERKRRLRPGELDKLIEACKGCKDNYYRLYAPFAIYLAIETGMRLQEIFNLRWEDINLEQRRIHIRHTKTDYKRKTDGRWIVLTVLATTHLMKLGSITKFPKDGNIFPMSTDKFKEAWASIIQRAGIPLQYRDYRIPNSETIVEKDGEGLTFHDLRREAGSKFKRCLTVDEIGAMLGHGDKTVTEIYLHYDDDDLTVIQDKLDRYALGGFTFKEALDKGMVSITPDYQKMFIQTWEERQHKPGMTIDQINEISRYKTLEDGKPRKMLTEDHLNTDKLKKQSGK